MTQAIVLITAVLTCLAATVVPLRFLPMIVAISVGVIIMLHGLLSRSRSVGDPDLEVTQPLPRLN